MAASQVALPSQLSNHVKALQDAKGVSGTLTFQQLPGAPVPVKFSFAKPNYYRIETDETTVVCDGKDVYRYRKSDNSYTVSPAGEASGKSDAAMPETWAWTAFFDAKALQTAESAKVGTKRSLKGKPVTGVDVAWSKPEPGTATVYVEDKTGVALGFNLKKGDKEWLVIGSEVTLNGQDVDPAQFAFAVPAGAKKVEATVEAAAGFASVQKALSRNCMPCHGSQSRAGGVDLSSRGAISANLVTPGSPEESRLYKVVSGPRPSMPKNRAPLSQADQKAIYDWIKDGAKD